MKSFKFCVFFSLLLIVVICSFAHESQAAINSVEFIVDFSDSMNQKLGSKTKLDVARELVLGTIDKLGEGVRTGLTLYGHREQNKCDDAEIVIPLKPADKQNFTQKLSEYKTSGNASTDAALRKATEILAGSNEYASFVLITDGNSKCEGDVFKAIREARQKYDYRFNFYAVLINPDNKESSKKYRFAVRSSDGKLFTLNSAAGIQNTIDTLVSSIKTAEPYYPKAVDNNDMALIPAGEFDMGTDEPNSDPLEWPKHKVYLDAFYIDTHEVTQKQYYEAMGQNPSFWIGSDLPTDSTSWLEAETFCKKVGKRLPTEAEWEKAAKGGRNDKWAGTSELNKLVEYSWIHDTGANIKTHPAGSRKPNPYGVYDMSGNVWEWVSDWYENGYYSKSPEKNPQGPEKGFLKILRGGNWDNHQYEVRTTSRYPKHPDVKYSNNGFRCAKDAEKTDKK